MLVVGVSCRLVTCDWDCLVWHNTLPESVVLADDVLPETHGSILATRRVQLTVRREPDTVNGTEVPFEGVYTRETSRDMISRW